MRAVPEANAKANAPEDVAFAKFRPVAVASVNNALLEVRFVIVPLVANKFVLVVFVPVAFVQVRPVSARLFERVRLANVAFVAKRLVDVEFVAKEFVLVVLVKTPVDGVVAPIAVLLMEPLAISADNATSEVKTAFCATKFVPVALAKLNKPVDVPLTKSSPEIDAASNSAFAA